RSGQWDRTVRRPGTRRWWARAATFPRRVSPPLERQQRDGRVETLRQAPAGGLEAQPIAARMRRDLRRHHERARGGRLGQPGGQVDQRPEVVAPAEDELTERQAAARRDGGVAGPALQGGERGL